MNIPSWDWLKGKMSMDEAEEEFIQALADLEQALETWRQELGKGCLSLPKHSVEPLYIGMN